MDARDEQDAEFFPNNAHELQVALVSRVGGWVISGLATVPEEGPDRRERARHAEIRTC